MALPTTNLTFHGTADTTTDLWQSTPPTFATHPTDGQTARLWDDVEHADRNFWVAAGTPPVWNSSTSKLPLPCVVFTGTNYLALKDDGSAFMAASNFLGASAKTLIFGFYAHAITSTGTTYDNQALMADNGGYFGVHLKSLGGGVYGMYAYMYDGAYVHTDPANVHITLDDPSVVVVTHDGTTLTITLYRSDGSSSSDNIADGATASLAGFLVLGSDYSGGLPLDGGIGEWALYNACLTGTNLTDARDWFKSRWLPSTGLPPGKARLYNQAVNRASSY